MEIENGISSAVLEKFSLDLKSNSRAAVTTYWENNDPNAVLKVGTEWASR